ncbi:MAG: GerAB/ArcD/ProY family transporter, partial [Clostridia bacterium]
MSDRKVGVASMVMLFLNLSLAKYLLVVPSFLVGDVGNSAWMVLILNGIWTAVLFAVIAALYKPYANMGLGEVSRRTFGKFLGGAVNVITAAVL